MQDPEKQRITKESQLVGRVREGTWGEGLLSRARGLLDYPHYTRPQSFRSWNVPEVLVSGDHEEIHRWRHQMAIEKTRRNRPDLLDGTTTD